MNKILLIIQREYLTRVKKKSFIIMTILGPLLIAAMIILPAMLSELSESSEKKIAVLDETGLFFESNDLMTRKRLNFITFMKVSTLKKKLHFTEKETCYFIFH